MSKIIAQLLALFALFFVHPGSVEPAQAQWAVNFDKKICTTNPDPFAVADNTAASCSIGSTAITPFTAVYYAITLQNPTGSWGAQLQETYPAGFTFLGVTCTVTSGPNQGSAFAAVASTSGTQIDFSNQLQASQIVICIIKGSFNNPGASVSNTVTVKDKGDASHTASKGRTDTVSATAVLPSDLSVTKTALPSSVDVSGSRQIVTYTIKIKNNGPEPLFNLAHIFELFDELALPPSGVALQADYVSGSGVCMHTPGADCLGPVPVVPSVVGWTVVPTTTWMPFQKWWFPTGVNGDMPVNGEITLEYKVRIKGLLECVKMPGGDGLRNRAHIGLTRIPGVTIDEIDPNNNTSPNTVTNVPNSDVAVITGAYVVDPECGLPTPGPIEVSKQLLTPQPTLGFAWGDPIAYRIKVANNGPSPITIRLRDIVQEWAGTPLFTATVMTWTCAPIACPSPAYNAGPVSLTGYYTFATVWDENNSSITIPGGNTEQLDITLRYDPTTCDSFVFAGLKKVRNIARVNYPGGVAEAFIDVGMKSPEKCNFQVDKRVMTNPNKIVFGSQFEYKITYQNADNVARTVGTLIDAIRIVQPNYATQLPFQYKFKCTDNGVSGYVPTSPGYPAFVPGNNAVFTTLPSQGARIIQQTGLVTFNPGKALTCNVFIIVSRPVSGDANCLSSIEPRLENLALMDVSRFYNANLPWPPSGIYNANSQNQPSPLDGEKRLAKAKALLRQAGIGARRGRTVGTTGGVRFGHRGLKAEDVGAFGFGTILAHEFFRPIA